MAEKLAPPDRSADLPPPYTLADPAKQYQETPTLMVDAKSGVFHSGARFNEFAKPVIPPPPPGCPPNIYQQMQMEKGQLNVVFKDSTSPLDHLTANGNKYGTF